MYHFSLLLLFSLKTQIVKNTPKSAICSWQNVAFVGNKSVQGDLLPLLVFLWW